MSIRTKRLDDNRVIGSRHQPLVPNDSYFGRVPLPNTDMGESDCRRTCNKG